MCSFNITAVLVNVKHEFKPPSSGLPVNLINLVHAWFNASLVLTLNIVFAFNFDASACYNAYCLF